jgi:hypothetical protein
MGCTRGRARRAKGKCALNELGQDLLFGKERQQLLVLTLALLNDMVLIEQIFKRELRFIENSIDWGRVRIAHFPKHFGAGVRGRGGKGSVGGENAAERVKGCDEGRPLNLAGNNYR